MYICRKLLIMQTILTREEVIYKNVLCTCYRILDNYGKIKLIYSEKAIRR